MGWLALVMLTALANASTSATQIGWGFTSVYALEGPAGVVIVDTHNPGRGRRIVRRLEAAGIDPERVTLILLTHAHPDHAGSAAELRELLDAPVAVGVGDVERLRSGRSGRLPVTGRRGRLIAPFVKRRFPGLSPDVVVDGELELSAYGVDATARVAGGHTAGSLVVDLGDGTVLTGDLIRAHIGRRHTPTLHFFHDDGVEAHRNLAAVVADPGVDTLLPAHGEALAANDVRDWLSERAPHHAARLERLATR